MATQGNTGGGNAVTVQTPQPQTSLQAPGGPFRRYTFASNAPMYTVAGQAFGATITQPLVATSAYARGFRVNIAAVGATGATTAAYVGIYNGTGPSTAVSDAPYNVVAQVLLQDAEGNNIISLPGWEALYLLPLINGSLAAQDQAQLSALPSFVGMTTTAGVYTAPGVGNFSFESYLPLEYLAGGIGVLGMNAASQLPQITWTLAQSSAVYATAPSTLPTITLQVDVTDYLIPNSVNIAPPQLGSSRQYKVLQGVPSVTSATNTPIYFPAYGGGYVDQLIFEARASGVRTDAAWPARLKLYIDGQLVDQPTLVRKYDDFAIAFGLSSGGGQAYAGGTAGYSGPTGAATPAGSSLRPTGVLVWNFRNALSQLNLGLLDSAEAYVSTTSQSVIQLGDIFQGTAQVNLIVGQVIPNATPAYGVTGA